MTTHIGRWLLVLLAVVGLAVTASVVGAHGTNTPAGTPADWTTAPAGADSQGPQSSGQWAGAPAETPAGWTGNGSDWRHHDGWQSGPGQDGAWQQPGGNAGPGDTVGPAARHGWQGGHGHGGGWQGGHGHGGGWHHAGRGC
jgi:hypothetical protein